MLSNTTHAIVDSERQHILLAAAAALELRPFAFRLGLEAPTSAIAHGKHGDRHVSLLSTGMGRHGDKPFSDAVRALQPTAVINVGLAGALDETHPAGSTWIVEEWRSAHAPHPRVVSSDARLCAEIGRSLAGAGINWGRAQGVMVDAPLHDQQARDRLRRSSGAHLVEMEGAAWAAIAGDLGVPFAAVRVVSDHANRPLPGPQSKGGQRAWLLHDDGRPRRLRLAVALLLSGAWLRPRRHVAEIRSTGGQLREAVAALEGVAAALLPEPRSPVGGG